MRISSIISDHMIFQRNKEFVIYGAAEPDTAIEAQMSGQSARCVTTQDGRFTLRLPAFGTGGPYTLVISSSDGEKKVFDDLWAGDVFLISGQSNMELPVRRTLDLYRAEVEHVQYPQIRMFQLPKEALFAPKRDLLDSGEWISVNPQSVMEFSALGYFFAEMKFKDDGVPVGLVHAAVGGVNIETFISEETLLKEAAQMRAQSRVRGDVLECKCDKNACCKWCYEERIAKHKNAEYVEGVKRRDRARIDAWYTKRDSRDKGLLQGWEKSAWSQDTCADTGSISLPGLWDNHPFGRMKGVVWLQRTVEVSEDFVGKKTELRLGTLVDADVTYVNGIEVGRTEYRYPPRRYMLPENILKAGSNVITIRLSMDANVGGAKPDMPYCIKNGDKEISLEGEWKTRIGTVEEALEGETFFAYQPTALYNSMIYAVRFIRFAGILFYQGESNCNRAEDYACLHQAMIKEWRELFGEELPYIYAQLPLFEGEGEDGAKAWENMQQQQAKAQTISGTRMAILHDLGQYNELHPQNKKEVAKRFYSCWCSFDKK